MSDLNDILSLGTEGPIILTQKFNIKELNELLITLNDLDVSNNNAFNSLISDENSVDSTAELKMVWETKERLYKLKEIISQSIAMIEKNEIKRENELMLLEHKQQNLVEQIVIEENQLKLVEKEIVLKISADSNKQFFYNFNQNGMEVINSVSVEIELGFEPIAPIPLRLQYNPMSRRKHFVV